MIADLLAHEWLLIEALIERSSLRIESLEVRLPDGLHIRISGESGEATPYELVFDPGVGQSG
jgi:hypothetical protein